MTRNETLQYYNQCANTFIEGTIDADMQEARERFLSFVGDKGHILDAGCGSGRDSKAFLTEGYEVTAIDGSEVLCQKASQFLGQKVLHQYFEDIDGEEIYDGIWACATLLHLPQKTLEQVLPRMIKTLRYGGCFYMSFKYGEFEGMRNGRYFTDYTDRSLSNIINNLQEVEVIEMWQTLDVRPDREEKWLNVLLKRVTKGV